MRIRIILLFLTVLTFVGIVATVQAHNNNCERNCHTETPHSTKTPKPCYEDCVSPSPTATPEVTTEPSATPRPEVPLTDPSGPFSAPTCSNGKVLETPFNFNVTREGDHAILQWVPTAGNVVTIHLYDASSMAEITAVEVPNNGYYVVRFLDLGRGYSFGVEQRNGCSAGVNVIMMVKDGPFSRLFANSYWIWSN